MIWFIIGWIIASVIMINAICDEWNDLGSKIVYSMLALITSTIVSFLVCFFVSLMMSSFVEFDYNIVSKTNIIALKDNQNVDGNFYLMGGYIDEDLYYYYATETEFGYKTEKIKADNAYIKYTDGKTCIEKYKGEPTNESVHFWGFPTCDYQYIIYVPEGTVTNEFNVDLE